MTELRLRLLGSREVLAVLKKSRGPSRDQGGIGVAEEELRAYGEGRGQATVCGRSAARAWVARGRFEQEARP